MLSVKIPGERFKAIREALQLSQASIGREIGISQGHWGDIERDEKNPSDTLIIALIQRFAVNKSYLERGEGEIFLSGQISDKFNEYEPNPEVQTLINRIKHIYQQGSEEQKALLYGQIGRVYDRILNEGGIQGNSGETDRSRSEEEKKTAEGYKTRKPA